MLVLLPVIDFVLMVAYFYRRIEDGRRAFVFAALVFGITVVALTETLSLFAWLTFPAVAASWTLIGLIVALLLQRARSLARPLSLRLTPLSWVIIGAVGLIMLLVGVTALVAPPNNWDSMDYHMVRVVHWIQNRSVAHYPTNFQPQLYQHPWAEFTITHLQILSGGDRFANLVQWFSLLGAVIAVSLTAKALGASARGQVLAAAICATIPMAIIQGSSTQNDLVLAFWMACVACFVAESAVEGVTGPRVLLVAAAAGLALATKAMAYIYLLPFAVWFGVLLLRRLGGLWKVALGAGALFVALNTGHLARNLTAYGSLSGPETGFYTNQVVSPAVFASNVVRNLALEIGVPASLDEQIHLSDTLTRAVTALHDQMGIRVNDRKTTIWTGDYNVGFRALSYNEDSAASPAHLLLGFVALILLILRRRAFRSAVPAVYLIVVLAGFALFCLILKLQPWHARLHLSLFVLFAAFIACVLDRLVPSLVSGALVVGLLLLATGPLLNNRTRPLLGEQTLFNTDRWTLMYAKRPGRAQSDAEAMRLLHETGCTNIGLLYDDDPWEYPFWAYSHDHGWPMFFEAVQSPFIESHFQPCAILRDRHVGTDPEWADNGETFALVWSGDEVDILLPTGKLTPLAPGD